MHDYIGGVVVHGYTANGEPYQLTTCETCRSSRSLAGLATKYDRTTYMKAIGEVMRGHMLRAVLVYYGGLSIKGNASV